MSAILNKILTHRSLSIQIGKEPITYNQETKRSVDMEILLLDIPLFGSVIAYAFGYIGWPVFLPLFYMIAMRVFIANHDDYHTDHRIRLPKVLEWLSENLAVVVTPWDDTHDSTRRKHLHHHATHTPGKSAPFNPVDDPHTVFELGGIFRVLLACLFYEEMMLYLDIRGRNIAHSRLIRALIYIPLQIAFILTFGWIKFLVVLLAMRIVGFTAWFVFSWAIHQPLVYKFGFSKQVPAWFKGLFALLHGRRVTEGCIHHATHHAWPTIPYNELHLFDTKVVQHPQVAPKMRPIGV